jgi:hypothetical protein
MSHNLISQSFFIVQCNYSRQIKCWLILLFPSFKHFQLIFDTTLTGIEQLQKLCVFLSSVNSSRWLFPNYHCRNSSFRSFVIVDFNFIFRIKIQGQTLTLFHFSFPFSVWETLRATFSIWMRLRVLCKHIRRKRKYFFL